jgi:hypothetical protein
MKNDELEPMGDKADRVPDALTKPTLLSQFFAGDGRDDDDPWAPKETVIGLSGAPNEVRTRTGYEQPPGLAWENYAVAAAGVVFGAIVVFVVLLWLFETMHVGVPK